MRPGRRSTSISAPVAPSTPCRFCGLCRLCRWRCGSSGRNGSGALFALLSLLLACGSSNVRPHFGPLPEAAIDTVQGEAALVIRAAHDSLIARGLRIVRFSAEEGYVETGWYHVDRRRPWHENTLAVERVIRVRVFADSAGPNAVQVAGEAVLRRTVDPSLPVRDTEVAVPPDHPGHTIIAGVLEGIRARFGRPPSASP